MLLQQIKLGLFGLEIEDYHAILGVPLNTDPSLIRKRYFDISRLLHPDSSKYTSDAQKALANALLSKLVNSAYENLCKGKSQQAEHALVLAQVGKRLALEDKLSVESKVAKELMKAGSNYEAVYSKFLKVIAANLYEPLEKATDKIGHISELNLVYLVYQAKAGVTTSHQPVATTRERSPQSAAPSTASEAEAPTPSLSESYHRRAQDYIDKNSFAKAVIELRDALEIEPKNATTHGLLGIAYLQQNQIGMARVHLNKALQIDPQNQHATAGKQALERIAPSTPPKPDKQEVSRAGGGGLLGGLFGGKKKK